MKKIFNRIKSVVLSIATLVPYKNLRIANPCKTCIVTPSCSQLCDVKREYRDTKNILGQVAVGMFMVILVSCATILSVLLFMKHKFIIAIIFTLFSILSIIHFFVLVAADGIGNYDF